MTICAEDYTLTLGYLSFESANARPRIRDLYRLTSFVMQLQGRCMSIESAIGAAAL
jgi:hypothetical protein